MQEALLALLTKYVQGDELTAEELEDLQQWRNASAHHEEVLDLLEDREFIATAIRQREAYADGKEKNWQTLVRNTLKKEEPMIEPVSGPTIHRIHLLRKGFFRYAAAAVLVGGVVGILLLLRRDQPPAQPTAQEIKTDIDPGGNRATLTLADGATIQLDSVANGQIAMQGNAGIYKQADGQISYRMQGNSGTTVLMNTMRTPRGGQYQLELPDGTKVWLNTASSISYPSAFTGGQRTVKLNGEAYFEVATDKQRPFVVEADSRLAVEVLGTSFNINCYNNEPGLRTTLLDGSVRLRTLQGQGHQQQQQLLLRPGQQGVLNTDAGSQLTVINNADEEGVLAWKNGYFNLQGAGFEELMKQLERWYDITVQYKGPIPAIELKGKMDRGVHLSGVLRLLSGLGVKSSLEGKVLTIH